MLRPLLLAAACAAAAPASAQTQLDPEAAQLLQEALVTTADAFVLPAYEAQADAASDLVGALGAHCGGGEALTEVQAAFADTYLAWQRSAVISVGPIAEAEGPMRVQMWPDPADFAGRAVRSALRAEDPALLAEGGLEGRSVALTNLSALEELVFDPLDPGSYACDLALAIARFQAGLATDLAEAWSPGSAFRAAYDTAAEGNATFASVEELVRGMLAGAVVYVDRMRKFKIERGFGTAPGEARAERTEARASGLGLASLRTGFATLAEFYDVPFGLFDAAPDVGGSMEYYVLGEAASSIAGTLALETRSLAEIAEEDGAAAQSIRGYADALLFHEAYLKSGFTDAIGMTAGFTAADGD